jgi:hypothetical protein
MAKTRITPRAAKFFEVLFPLAYGNATEAARLAGFSKPESMGTEVKRRYPEAYSKAKQRAQEELQISVDEAMQRLGDLVRDREHKDHYKALETALRIHGMLDTKVSVILDKSEMLQSYEHKRLDAPVLDVEILPAVESKVPQS